MYIRARWIYTYVRMHACTAPMPSTVTYACIELPSKMSVSQRISNTPTLSHREADWWGDAIHSHAHILSHTVASSNAAGNRQQMMLSTSHEWTYAPPTHIRTQTYAQTFIRTYVRTYLWLTMYYCSWTHSYIHMCMYVRMYVCTYSTYVCTYVRTSYTSYTSLRHNTRSNSTLRMIAFTHTHM